MRKKFVSALLFGALITASTSTLLVSCKDYDDDLTEIRGIIAENETDLTSLIEGKVETVNAEIDRLNSQAEELASAYKEADEALQAAIAGAETNANAYADIQRAEAEKASIEAARKMVDEAVATLEASISAANAKIEEQGKSIAALISADAELTKGIEAAKARANEAYALAEKAEKLAEENATEIGGLKTTLSTITTNLQTVKDNLNEEIRLLNGKVADLLAKAETQAATITSLEGQLKSLRESNETAIQNLKDKDSELIEKIEKDNKAIGDRLDTEVADLKKQAEDNLTEAKTYTDAEIQKVSSKIDDLTATVNGVKVNISDLNLAIDGLKVDIKGIENAYKAADTALRTDLEGMIGDLEDQLETLKSNQTSTDNAQNGRIKALEDLLAAIGDGDIKKFSEKVQGMDTNIDDLKVSVTSINASLAYEGKRLKSLVFAPTAYIDGIECIKFTTLQYKDWGTNKNDWEADAAKSSNVDYYIDDKEHAEEYLVNPKNVLAGDILSDGVKFVSNTATNTTRAVSESAPIDVASWEITNGVMKLKIKKANSKPIGDDRKNFTIVALKATLSDKFLTEEEIKNGEKAEVYSDWARLYETSQTPYIHNKTRHDKAGKPTESEEDSHFWNYSTVYNNKTKADALPTEFNGEHIAAEVYYKNSIDLLSLVEVCDKDGELYDMEKYDLAFEFHVMDYVLENENDATDKTNQKHFAKLNEDGHTLVSTARDNTTTGNRDAIGRQPMIQAVLKDVRDPKQEKVVDVRYFKIKWIDKIDVTTYKEFLGNFTEAYKCEDPVVGDGLRVFEENMNKLYTTYNMSRDEFHNKYTLHSGLFESEAEAMKENGTVAAKFGTIVDQADAGGAGQTHNLLWTIGTKKNAATQAEYEAGYKEIIAWGYFVDKVNPKSRIIFPVKLTLTIAKMDYAVNKEEAMWNGALDTRGINPILEDDKQYGLDFFATTQLRGDFLIGYNGSPATIDDLVKNSEEAVIVFNEAKLGTLPKNSDTDKWTISDDGLTLYYNNEKAAVISGSDIQLWESQNGAEGSKPSVGAKLLVGKNVPVKVVGKYCELVQIVDAYNMNFITPLVITASTKNVEVKDVTAGGGSSETLAGSIEVKEDGIANKRVVWNNKTGKDAVDNAVLRKWYGFEEPVYSIPEARTNIQKNGSIGSVCNVLLSDIKNADGTKKFDVEVSGTGGNTKVTFKNMSGNAIGQEFKILIPVTIKTKWQDMKAEVIVTVKPNI